MADDKIRYTLDVDDKGTPKVVKFGNESEKAGKKAEKGFAGAGEAVSSLGERIPGVGGAMAALSGGPMLAAAAGAAALIGGFGMMVMSSIDAADSMNDLSLRLGISTERLSVLSLYAEQSGTDIDTLAKAMGKLGAKVADGDGTLKAMGVTASSTDEALFQVADKIAATEDPMMRLKLATDAFGKSGQDMLPLLVQGGEALREMGGSAAIVTTEMARMSDEFNDGMAVLKAQATDVGMKLATAVLPHMLEWLEGVDNIRLGLNGVLDLLFDIDPLLNDAESRSKGRQAIIDQYAELQKVKQDAANAGYISQADALKNVLIDGKNVIQALKAFDEKPKPKDPEKTPGTSYESDAEKREREAAAKKRAADRLTARKKALSEEEAAVKASNDRIAAYNDKVSAVANERRDMAIQAEIAVDTAALTEEEAAIKASADRVAAYNANISSVENERRDMALQQELARQAQIEAGWMQVASSMSSLWSDALFEMGKTNGDFYDTLSEGFTAMIGKMVADLVANAAIFGILSLIPGANAAGFAAGLGGLGSAILGSFDTGTRALPATGPIIAHQGEAILPAPISAAARSGNWQPAMQFMGQGSRTTNNSRSTSSTTNNITIQVTGAQAMDYKEMGKVLQRATAWQERTRTKGSR